MARRAPPNEHQLGCGHPHKRDVLVESSRERGRVARKNTRTSHLFPRTGLIRRMMESGKGSRGKEEPYDRQRKLFPSAGTPRNKLTRVRIRSVYDYSAPVVHFARGVCKTKVNCIVFVYISTFNLRYPACSFIRSTGDGVSADISVASYVRVFMKAKY